MQKNIRPVKAITHILTDDGVFPNNPSLPLIVYKQALQLAGDAAATIESIFESNGWSNSWRNGIYDYHHYHGKAHEVLGIYSGHASVQLGGPSGVVLDVTKGDVIIIPAGVAHKNLGASEDFKCVGAYPKNGENYDTNRGEPGERPATDQNISNVPLPDYDPVYGNDGKGVLNWNQ